jgi:hypothetical protein
MNILLCCTHTYKYLEDYILSILPIINAKIIIFDNVLNITFLKKNRYLFIQSIPANLLSKIIDLNIYLINTEQLCDTKKLQELSYATNDKINIIDYSFCNLQYYNTIRCNKKYYLPYQINYKEYHDITKTHDICLIGDIIPKNRQNIIDILKSKNINVDIISGFGKDRDTQLFKYKILLNIGYFDFYKTFEHIRCDRCVYNKMIVISDKKHYTEENYLKDYIIFDEYNNIPNTVYNVLHNYNYYYQLLFSNFNLNIISNKISELSKDIVDELTTTIEY